MIYALDGEQPEIDPTAWIAPGAHIIGRVRIGAHASVWFGATLRGDNEPIVLGEGSNVQENAVLHTDHGFPLIIGANCTIGHKAMLHGCTIGAGSLVGMAATILNGAEIGPGSLVGAASLVTERKVFGARSLIMGAPAKLIRELDDARSSGLLNSAQTYVLAAERFRLGLRQVEGS